MLSDEKAGHNPGADAQAAEGSLSSGPVARVYVVREEPLEQAGVEALRAFEQTRSGPVNPQRFTWLYRSNPDGPAVLWTIREQGSGRMAGFRVGLPRRVLVDGQLRTAWNGGDFSIYQEYRTLGVALKLDRAIRDGVDAGRVGLCYTFPTERMQIIHDRVGFRRIGTVARLVKPLRTAYYLRRRWATRWLAGLASGLGDRVLSRRGPERRHAFTYPVHNTSPARFDPRFDRLFETAARSRRVIGVRDERYLAWRHAQNPLHAVHCVEAGDGARLAGYGVFRADKDVGYIQDVLGADPAALNDVVAGLLLRCRDLGLSGVEASFDEGNPTLGVLEAFGFVRRLDSSAVYAYAPQDSPIRDAVLGTGNWLLAIGDRDV